MRVHQIPSQLEILSYYSKRFQRIRVDRAHGIAPHKPLLLLSVIEMISHKEIQENKIYLSSELIQKFLKYWSYLGSESHHPDISRPYFHMRSGKFWHLMANPGYENVISSKVKLKTFFEVKRSIEYAYLDEDLFDLMNISKYRESLLSVLVGQWFPGRLDEVMSIAETNLFSEE